MEPTERRNFLVGLFAVGISPLLINGAINPAIVSRPWLYWGFELLSWVVLPVVVFRLAVTRGELRASDLGLATIVRGRKRVGLLLLLCLLAGPLYLTLYASMIRHLQALFPGRSTFCYQCIVPEHGSLRVVTATYLALTAGIVEELYFRGLFFKISGFSRDPVAIYLVLSPLLFALVHWEGGLASVLASYGIGVVSALVFLRIRNLWPLIVGHVFTDLFWFLRH